MRRPAAQRARRALRLYALLLWLYPQSFRRRFGAGMRHAFSRELREAVRRGRLAVVRFWLRSLGHALVFGLAERCARSDRSPGTTSAGASGRLLGEAVGDVLRETRFALRRLRRAPAFTAATSLTIALGIGATTAVFSLVDGVVLRPLPYPRADRLVLLGHSAPGAEMPELGLSSGTYVHYLEGNHTFAGMALCDGEVRALTGDAPGDAAPERVTVALVTPTFFDLVLPAGGTEWGRPIREEDDRPGAAPVALISHRLFERRFGGDAAAVGRRLLLDGTAYTIIGVLPARFALPSRATDVWLPLRLDPAAVRLGAFSYLGIGRLADGVAVAQARDDLQALVPRLDERFPGPSFEVIVERGRLTVAVTPLREQLVGGVDKMLFVLLGTVGFVLLIASANVANLLLVRAAARQRELAMRRVLGAGRGAMARHDLAESVLLGGLGGIGGVAFAALAVALVKRFSPYDLPRLEEVGVDGRVLAFAAAVSLVCALVFGILPAVRGVGRTPFARPGATPLARQVGTGGARLRSVLVVSQVALALVLLVAAGLLVRSFWRLSAVAPGFETGGRWKFQLALPRGAAYPDRESAVRFHRRLMERLAALPEVARVGAADCLPLTGCSSVNPLTREGDRPLPGEIPAAVEMRGVAPGYLRAMGIPLVAGRDIEWRDLEGRTGATVVSRSLAERRWPGRSPLGTRIYPSVGEELPWYTVVGVAEDVRDEHLSRPPRELAYFPLLGTDEREMWAAYSLFYVLELAGGEGGLESAIRNQIRSLDAGVVVARLEPLGELVSREEAPTAFAMLLLSAAAGLALILGVVGLYGVIGYSVLQRRGEIGVRIALGAEAADVHRMVLRWGTGMVLVGTLFGLAGALALARLLRFQLFEIEPYDPATYGAVTAILVLAALLAAYLPARRAARQDPLAALRTD